VIIGYGKLGRSMPLTLEKCANLGGDVEMVAVVKEMALRHPDDTFLLLGRNTGEDPVSVGLPANVINPWRAWGWADEIRNRGNEVRKHHAINANGSNLSVQGQVLMREIFNDVTLDTFRKCDGMVMWVGQHGSTNTPIPTIVGEDKLTKPYDWCAYYASFILQGVNQFREGREDTHDVVWLNADARNAHKMRDLKHPLRNPILTQYDFTNRIKHEQYDGTPPISSTVRNIYSRLEINGLAPGTPFGDLITYNSNPTLRDYRFGMFINEARAIGVKAGMDRLSIMKEWVLPIIDDNSPENPHWVHGSWSEKSQDELGFEVKPAPWDQYYPMLNNTLCTFTTPSSGSHWATAKPWEAFAGGTICLFHPDYDKQDHILKDADHGLRSWLRCNTPRDLKTRVAAICANPSTAQWLITKQREHFEKAMKEKTYLRMIEEKIWSDDAVR
jgi:hypothetical protein